MPTDSTIPQPRVIVLCFDGTNDRYDATNTNVVKLYSLLKRDCPSKQIVYYQPGIGTFSNAGTLNPALRWITKKADEAFAWHLSAHVLGGYMYLMQNYRAGDKVCIFGFSRGAYTARALAGLLFKIGLLPRDNKEQIPFAYHLYKRTDDPGKKLAEGFKKTFCAHVTIDFLGVWDTVASVGLIYGRGLPFTSANSAVTVFRHALSLDEHRARFQPNMFHREPSPSLPVNSDSNPESGKDAKPRPLPKFGIAKWGIATKRHASGEQHQIPSTSRVPSNPKVTTPEGPPPGPSSMTLASSDPVPPVLEVWFAGCHADVGGGAVKNTDPHSPGDISLRWMIKQVVLSKCEIMFDNDALKRADINISTLVLDAPTRQDVRAESEVEPGPALPTLLTSSSPGEDGNGEHMTRKGKDRDVEKQPWPRKRGVLADAHDQLKIQPMWWFLEILPMKFTWQGADGAWESKWGINFGRGRQIRDAQPIFHDSVRQRMAVAELNYRPRAKWMPGTERYVF